MTQLVIEGELAERLEAIARRENRAVEEVLASMIKQYEASVASETARRKAQENQERTIKGANVDPSVSVD